MSNNRSLHNHSIDNKRIAKNTGMLYIRQLFVLSLALYTSRLTLQVLGETDFGIYAVVGGLTALISVLTNSMSGSTLRFLTFELGRGDVERVRAVYSTAMFIHLFVAVILIVLAETVGLWFFYHKLTIPVERMEVAFWVYQLSVFTCALAICNVPNTATVTAHEDMGAFAALSMLDAVLKLSAVGLLFLLSWDKLLFYALFLAAIQTMDVLVYIVICKRRYRESRMQYSMDRPLAKKMFGFAGWTIVYNLSTTGFIQGVNVLLNMFFGPILNAAYTVAMQAYSGIRSFCSGFQLASNPQIVKLYSTGEYAELHKLVMTTCKISFFLILLMSLPFMVNSEYVLSLWLKNVPPHANAFFCLLLVFAYIDVFAYPMDVAAQATGKIKRYNLLSSLAIISVLPLAYVAFKLGAIAESIYMIAIAMSGCGLLIRLYLLSRLIGLCKRDFMVKVFLRSVAVALLSYIVPCVLRMYIGKGLPNLLLSFCVSFISVAVFVYALGLNGGERLMVRQMVAKTYRKVAGR